MPGAGDGPSCAKRCREKKLGDLRKPGRTRRKISGWAWTMGRGIGFDIRRLYRPEQQVCLGKSKAVVTTINEVSVVFDSEEGDIHVPHSQLIAKGYQA